MSPSKRKRSEQRQAVSDANENALLLEPASTFDEAIVGVSMGASPVAIYDYALLVEALINHDQLTEEEAVDHIEYNILGSIGAENYPIVIRQIEDIP